MLGLKSLRAAKQFIAGIEVMHMVKKEQIDLRDKSVRNSKEFIPQLSGLTA